MTSASRVFMGDDGNRIVKPRVLFLDDMEERHEAFEDVCGDLYDITHVYDVDSCLEQLTNEEFLVCFLDHDLSETAIMCDPDDIDEKTGTDVAIWISTHLDPNRGAYVIHSLNPIGAMRMHDILHKANFDVVRIPFYQLIHMR